MAVAKEHILSEIQRTAKENGGRAPGVGRFFTETGIKVSDWRGKYWARWSDAPAEAGLGPNTLSKRRADDDVFRHLSALVKEMGRFPTQAEIDLKKRRSQGFPSNSAFRLFGGKNELAAKLKLYCLAQGDQDVAALIPSASPTATAET